MKNGDFYTKPVFDNSNLVFGVILKENNGRYTKFSPNV